MLAYLQDNFLDLMRRGGLVMWPLLATFLVAVTLVFERCWFWARTNHLSRLRRVTQMARLLRRRDWAGVKALAEGDASVYGRVMAALLHEGRTEVVAMEAVEAQRSRLERFMPTLSTIITAAPMLGILGTVTGIISSFQVLSNQTQATDPQAVSEGIAEALLTTAVGLVIAIGVLLPYNAFRAQVDKTLARLDTLAASAVTDDAAPPGASAPPAVSPGPSPDAGASPPPTSR